MRVSCVRVAARARRAVAAAGSVVSDLIAQNGLLKFYVRESSDVTGLARALRIGGASQ